MNNHFLALTVHQSVYLLLLVICLPLMPCCKLGSHLICRLKIYRCVFISVERLSDFTVYVSDVSFPPPDDQPFAEPDYHVCATYVGYPPGGTAVIITCQQGPVWGWGTHLYIQQPRVEFLTLCEVEVYGWGKGKRMKKHQRNFSLKNNTTSYSS